MTTENPSIRFLYGTVPGRILLKLLVNPSVSRGVGRLLDTKASVCLIPHFVRKFHIDTWDIVVPEGGYRSFNEFFAREREEEKIQRKEGELLSPCDGLFTCIPIRKHTVFDIKHTKFTLEELLQSRELAEAFSGGHALIFRLTPSHYHRYCYAADGMVKRQKSISGILHCVRPVATGKFPVYVQNSRKYQVIQTKEFGKIIQMEVGALLVGKITNHPLKSRQVKAGQEKGYFEYGGSTIILLLRQGRISLSKELLQRSNKGTGETPVRKGMVLGCAES